MFYIYFEKEQKLKNYLSKLIKGRKKNFKKY